MRHANAECQTKDLSQSLVFLARSIHFGWIFCNSDDDGVLVNPILQSLRSKLDLDGDLSGPSNLMLTSWLKAYNHTLTFANDLSLIKFRGELVGEMLYDRFYAVGIVIRVTLYFRALYIEVEIEVR